MGRNKSGMPPEHSQTLPCHFWRKENPVKNIEQRAENHETSTGRKTVLVCVWKIISIKKTRIAMTRIFTVR